MSLTLSPRWQAATVLCVGAILIGVLLLQIAPYKYRLSAVFHMDEIMATANPLPHNFVVLTVPSYDGAQYYHVARNITTMFHPSRWRELREKSPASYAYQRFLLPLFAFLLSGGLLSLLPFTFVGVNILAILLTTLLCVRSGLRPLYACALALCPATMLAMHFTLAEPLTILLLTFVLLRYRARAHLGLLDIVALSLVVLAREVNILFIAYLGAWCVYQGQWKNVGKLLCPALVFLSLHTFLFLIFWNIPFLISAGARQIPGSAIAAILLGLKGWDGKTLSSTVLFLGFFLPCSLFILLDSFRRRQTDVFSLGALTFFGVMLLMPDYIWGSVTSIGRVITPVYPLTVLALAYRDTILTRVLALMIIFLGLSTGIGLALIVHPTTLIAS